MRWRSTSPGADLAQLVEQQREDAPQRVGADAGQQADPVLAPGGRVGAPGPRPAPSPGPVGSSGAPPAGPAATRRWSSVTPGRYRRPPPGPTPRPRPDPGREVPADTSPAGNGRETSRSYGRWCGDARPRYPADAPGPGPAPRPRDRPRQRRRRRRRRRGGRGGASPPSAPTPAGSGRPASSRSSTPGAARHPGPHRPPRPRLPGPRRLLRARPTGPASTGACRSWSTAAPAGSATFGLARAVARRPPRPPPGAGLPRPQPAVPGHPATSSATSCDIANDLRNLDLDSRGRGPRGPRRLRGRASRCGPRHVGDHDRTARSSTRAQSLAPDEPDHGAPRPVPAHADHHQRRRCCGRCAPATSSPTPSGAAAASSTPRPAP